MTVAFLRANGVTKRYGDRAAVDDVSVEIVAGESIVILGPSGCGKTTLLRLIAGLTRPDAGEISIAGRTVSGPSMFVPPHQRKLGFVFQDLALWPHMTVRDNLEFVMKAVQVPKAERSDRAGRVLRLVHIDELSDRYPHQLSGGEQQRVAVARAIVGEPSLLLLDEPLASLDTDLRATLRRELRRLQQALRVTTIYVTHDREDAAILGDRLIYMRQGRITSVEQRMPQEGPP